ncbi:hypothetical protein ACHAPE_006803 [Trichoderma viride]
MCQAIQGSGLYKSSEALISVVSSLCARQKLFPSQGIVELARSRANEFEKQQNWRAAGEVYLWLNIRIDAFGVESYGYARIVAATLTFQNTVRDMIEQRRPEQIDETQALEEIQGKLCTTMLLHNAELLYNLEALCKFQDENGQRKEPETIRTSLSQKHQGLLFSLAEELDVAFQTHLLAREILTKEDVFNRTFLHYCAAFAERKDRLWKLLNNVYKPDRFRSTILSILESGSSINSSDMRGWTPLHYACQTGNAPMAQLLLEFGASVDMPSHGGTAPIHFASRGDSFKTIKILVESGASINATDETGKTALHFAIFNGSKRAVEYLCQRGGQKLRDKCGRTALHLAAMGGETAVLDLIEEDVNSTDYKNRAPIHLAAKAGLASITQNLIKRGAFIDAQDRDGFTPLHLACREGHDKVVEALLDAGAAIDCVAEGSGFWTPLHSAVGAQKESIVELLAERNANVSAALRFAVESSNAAMVQYLLEAKQTSIQERDLMKEHRCMEQRETEGLTPLHYAAYYHRLEHTQLLVQRGANREARDRNGYTPLRLALMQSYGGLRLELVQLLIGLGADVNTVDNGGSAPLHSVIQLAESVEMVEIVEELLRAGARVNQADSHGYSPLHMAAKEMHLEIIEWLIELGADVNAVTRDWKTPKMLADEVFYGWWAENTRAK